MKPKEPFEDKLSQYQGKISPHLEEAATYVTDTLALAWAAAQQVFQDRATPEHALTLLEHWLSRANAAEQLQLQERICRHEQRHEDNHTE